MLYMNEWDLEENKRRWARHPVLGPATAFLVEYADQVNAHSDGWPYWKAPRKAALRLMELINSGRAEALDLQKALRPIKAFMTRRGTAAGMVLTYPKVKGV